MTVVDGLPKPFVKDVRQICQNQMYVDRSFVVLVILRLASATKNTIGSENVYLFNLEYHIPHCWSKVKLSYLLFSVSGARCVATLLNEMKRRGKDCRFGVISMCIGLSLFFPFLVHKCRACDAS